MTALRVDGDATELRRALGPVAWFVLEELLLGPGNDDGRAFVAPASARSLALSASLNKDTVARALAILGRAGVVAALEQANDGGRFGPGGYRVDPVAGVRRIADTAATSAKPSSMASRTHRADAQQTHHEKQLALLDVPPSTDAHSANPRPDRRRKPDDALAPGVRPGGAGRQRDGGGTTGTAARPC